MIFGVKSWFFTWNTSKIFTPPSALKKLRRAEGGAKIVGVFRVKNYDFTPKKSYFFNCRGRRENFWGISCEKSRFYAKNHIFSNPPPLTWNPGSAPAIYSCKFIKITYSIYRGNDVLFIGLKPNTVFYRNPAVGHWQNYFITSMYFII
jgi:hypothetical protein